MRRNRKAAEKAPERNANAPKKKFSFNVPKSKQTEQKSEDKPFQPKKYSPKPKKGFSKPQKRTVKDDNLMRLNRYLAHSGICSRREADTFIEAGLVEVNGKVVTQLGTKVAITDVVKYGGQSIRPEKPVYVLLNKPKDFITTVEDDRGRKTVQSLVEGACKERIYPVGRLDRQTTGLLLFTNDGDLAKKLTHPKHGIKKIYQVTLHKNVAPADLKKLEKGVNLDDGFINVDQAVYVDINRDKKIIGVELHSGKNRIIRRLFEALGYNVVKLDRTVFAGLNKKNLPRGNYRFLTGAEITQLKMM